ncbi:S-adenosyl-L-homocysteine hydrolase [Qipengyuania sp. GH1]|uniref:S-adenosyl-L-homocysteine hydrolase n=1 Tax=Qipengyuania aestuarii TaxID=2867241 RepID=UPI001C868653|nr:S-adenosyl-L-homocysteine hydrolase [Qipengyuania aestuarii]MBX7534529.1 S-adenosyl-L-homocysteine hydrolase [Qipengyuania aestuarii]
MHFTKKLGVASIAAALVLTPTAASATSQDEQVRRLDIMLMVTSLRCRMGADDFQPHYRKFSATHITALNSAARRLEGGLVAAHGKKGAKRALDRISVGMANEYGQGHPWLGCAELKEITEDLSKNSDPAVLAQAADELLGPAPRSGGLWARR